MKILPLDLISKIYQELNEEDNLSVIQDVLTSGLEVTLNELNSFDKILLYRILSSQIDTKSGVSPLSISSTVIYQISKYGELQNIKTKAWDKSRLKLQVLRRRLIHNCIVEYNHKFGKRRNGNRYPRNRR